MQEDQIEFESEMTTTNKPIEDIVLERMSRMEVQKSLEECDERVCG